MCCGVQGGVRSREAQMRVVGKHRMGKSGMGKVEGPRVVGIGLMSLGAMALVLSVAGAAGAGSTAGGVANPAHQHVPSRATRPDGAIAQVLQARRTTRATSRRPRRGRPVTTTTHKQCGCGTTTTWHEPVTTTTHEQCGCSTTTTVPETTTSTTQVAGTTIVRRHDVGSTTTSSTTGVDDDRGAADDSSARPPSATRARPPPTVHKAITVEGNTARSDRRRSRPSRPRAQLPVHGLQLDAAGRRGRRDGGEPASVSAAGSVASPS